MKKQHNTTELAQTQSSRFTEMVMNEFVASVPEMGKEMTTWQKKLCQNYFIKIDTVLKKAEQSRQNKSEEKRDSVPVDWNNINLKDLALNVVAWSRVGLDPMEKNHLAFIPFKNNHTGMYDINFMPEYRGLELKAKKYGLDIPDEIIIEIVYSKDKFRPIKKDMKNDIESYEFTISDNPFERGEISGGFYYYKFNDNPSKNKLIWLNIHQIEKRRPEYASAEFWGGEKTKWKNGKPSGKEQIEGWKDEMVYKTLARAAYNNITIDSKKIEDAYRLQMHEDLDLVQIEEVTRIADPNSKMLETEKKAENVISKIEADKKQLQEKDELPPYMQENE